jgi:hypothetical protein
MLLSRGVFLLYVMKDSKQSAHDFYFKPIHLLQYRALTLLFQLLIISVAEKQAIFFAFCNYLYFFSLVYVIILKHVFLSNSTDVVQSHIVCQFPGIR